MKKVSEVIKNVSRIKILTSNKHVISLVGVSVIVYSTNLFFCTNYTSWFGRSCFRRITQQWLDGNCRTALSWWALELTSLCENPTTQQCKPNNEPLKLHNIFFPTFVVLKNCIVFKLYIRQIKVIARKVKLL